MCTGHVDVILFQGTFIGSRLRNSQRTQRAGHQTQETRVASGYQQRRKAIRGGKGIIIVIVVRQQDGRREEP